MPKHGWIFALAVILCGGIDLSCASAAGPRFIVDKWTTDDGLPQSSVITMMQTDDGYLWLGTLSGLVRFDGANFTVFDESNVPELNDNEIVHLFQDSHGNIWLGTRSDGAVLIKNGRTINLGIGRGSREGRLMAACEDETGTVWLYTADGQLCRYKNEKMDIWNLGNTGDRFSNCRTMIAEKSGMVWVGTDTRLYGIDPQADLGPTDLPIKQGIVVNRGLDHRGLDFLLASERGGSWRLAGGQVQKWKGNQREKNFGPYPWKKPVFTACEDAEGNLIVGTLGDGIWWFNAEGKATQLSSAGQGLSSDYILSLLVDREGTLWAGTDGGGLDRIRRQTFTILAGTEATTIQSACEDKQGNLWLNSKGGVLEWNNNRLTNFGTDQGMLNPNGQVMFVDASQRVWAGSGGPLDKPGLFQLVNGLFQVVPGSQNFNPEISAIYQDHAGTLWVGTQGGLAQWDKQTWKLFTTKDGLSSDAVQAIAEDAAGNLWIGTGSGLDFFHDEQFKVYHQRDGLPGDDISSLYSDSEGVLWVGTHGRGLGRFKDGSWTRYGKSQGLLNDNLGYLIEDGRENFWIGSHAGLMRVSKPELNRLAQGLTNAFFCRLYGKEDGLLSGECTTGSQPGPCRARDGKLWFPTIRGLAGVDPAQIKINTNLPTVAIETVTVNNRVKYNHSIFSKLPAIITVPYNQEQIDIKFATFDLSSPHKLRFKYKMQKDGHQTAWTQPGGGSQTATISPLPPPGKYHFQVIAANEDGIWNNAGAAVAFIIEPPFWRTAWFLSIVTLVILGLIVGLVYYFSTQRLQRQLEGMRQQEALEKEAVADRAGHS